jgi:copper chaperone
MYLFTVPDMTCGHCASTITRALRSEDPQAQVEIDLKQHQVRVKSVLGRDEIAERIAEAGYSPTPVAGKGDGPLFSAT